MLPPVTLPELVTFATWSFRCAPVTRRAPTPLTLTRRRARCTPPVPVATPASTDSSALVPKLAVGRLFWTDVSATTVPTTGAAAGGGGVVAVVEVVVV